MTMQAKRSPMLQAELRAGSAQAAIMLTLAAACVPGVALAQNTPPAQAPASTPAATPVDDATPADGADQDIVVTGTLLKGSAPVGQGLISLGLEQAMAQGATTSNEMLATIPQVSNLFVTVPNNRLNVAANQIQVVRPNLRNLSPETGSSSSTLVLIDGHRIAGAGVTQSGVDPDVVPQAAIQRVEVVVDGGSATYGADAVGGVINFITRQRFDGIKIDGRYGFADQYWTADANLLIGKDWGSGSIFGAYSFQKNDDLFGRDRDFVQAIDFNTGIAIGRQCNPGNVSVGGVNYALPGLTAGIFNACDASDDSTIIPKVERHAGLIGLHQELNSSITVNLRAFYGKRDTLSNGPLRSNVTVTSSNFYYRPVTVGSTASQSVAFTFAPVLGNESAPSGSGYKEWGANADLTAKLFGDWEARGLFNYSESKSYYYNVGLNQTLLTAAGSGSTAATAVNFYNPAGTTNVDLIRAIANSEIGGQSKDRLFNARGIFSGSLFQLPGGDVRLALGYEFASEGFQQRVAPANAARGAINNAAYVPYNRRVNSAFAELQVPIFGADNRMPGFYSLILSGSVRYDHFSDFGSTTNPKFGVTWKPLSWWTLRGNYSTSFNAPTPVDQLGALRNTISFFGFNAFVKPGDVPIAQGTVALQGSTPNLKPQTAKTWSVGTDIDVPFISGLRVSASLYNVTFSNLLTIPTPSAQIFTNFPDNVISNVNGVSNAQLLEFAKLSPNGLSVIQPLVNANTKVYELVNFLSGNYGALKVRGSDFSVNYRHPTDFGGIDASVSGNYQFKRSSKPGPGSPLTDDLAFNTPKLTLQGTLGVDIGAFRAQATVNHVSGFALQRSAALPQDRLGAFDVVNLFFRYKLPEGSGLTKDLALTLNVNNVLDTDPPLYKTSGFGGNGYNQSQFTLGRLFMFGISKQF